MNKKAVYINEMGCVASQETTAETLLESPVDYSNHRLIYALDPEYKEYIPAGAIRRLGKGIKMSLVAAARALEKSPSKQTLDGIIVGTGLGCINDSEKFVSNLIKNDEQYLTPTPFIQSTHNTVGGQIALSLGCKAYNFTYVNAAVSFQSALLDAWAQISFEDKAAFLVGGVDEIGTYSHQFSEIIGAQKPESDLPTNILENRTKGAVGGEGAAFFVLESKKNEHTLAKIADISMTNTLSKNELFPFMEEFLQRNNLRFDEVDVLLLGNNGDSQFDGIYDEAEAMFNHSVHAYYKHLFGEFFTSPAIAFWLGARILSEGAIPSVLLKKKEIPQNKKWKNILIFTQYRGKDFSLMLLEDV